MVPELEKLLVDHNADKDYAGLEEAEIQKEFQRAFELYPVNTSRLLRYAGRKGKKEEILRRLEQLDEGRVRAVHAIQDFFRQEPIVRAWLFGSFSRMEERPESDIDILIDLDMSVPMGLLQYAGMINTLENLLKRKVDLVTNGTVKPFAQESINRDKVLIYERA
ncbi:MAG: nucleotidyltransferase domain-containing protein [Bacteroidales bacterium]|nr:nucleotidyltransferase domain-containing protein [Bacteroidales bacterium]